MSNNLLDGYNDFFSTFFQSGDKTYEELRDGQNPSTLVIACSDSRVDPAILFNASPGDLFVVRNVANMVPSYAPDKGCHGTSSAIEFACRHLKVSQLVVLGHSNCAGVRALYERKVDEPAFEFIGPWVEMMGSARDKVASKFNHEYSPDAHQCCAEECLKNSVKNLLTFPFIKDMVAAGQLSIFAWMFHVENGRLSQLTKSGEFALFNSEQDYSGPVAP